LASADQFWVASCVRKTVCREIIHNQAQDPQDGVTKAPQFKEAAGQQYQLLQQGEGMMVVKRHHSCAC
jgi:hypothetical protein